MRYNVAVTDTVPTLRADEIAGAHPVAVVLAVTGELDLVTISVLKDAVGRRLAPNAWVVLDLTELTFCDSTGLGALVGLHREAGAAGARLLLAAARRRVADLFTLSGIDQVLSVYADLDGAFASVG